jgi:hypothetical protein
MLAIFSLFGVAPCIVLFGVGALFLLCCAAQEKQGTHN